MATSLATLTRQRVRTIVEAEFSAEGWTVLDDKLLRAEGHDGVTRVAVYPEAERERSGHVDQLECPVVLQIYLGYQAKLDEHQKVDPTIVEDIAARLREAFQTQSSGSTGSLWFLRLTGIEYPDDPTGNKSRLEARIVGFGENPAGTYA